ncbi:CHAT domain-containing protein [Leptospira meyeri]|nr:CHAT domain-containing protein [Leptospira meyeri]
MKEEREEVVKIWNKNRLVSKQLVGYGLTKNRLLEKISSMKYIHYSGHSYRDGIYLSDDIILDAETIASFDLSNVQLVYFNSCSSATLLANAFLQAGAKEVVGYLGDVRNDVAREAGKGFWSEFLKSRSSSFALKVVRSILEMKFGKGYPGAYQLVHFGEYSPANQFGYIPSLKKIYSSGIILFLAFVVYLSFFKEENTKYQELEMVFVPAKNSSGENKSIAIRKNSKLKTESIDSLKVIDKKYSRPNSNIESAQVDKEKDVSNAQEKSKIGNLERFLDQHHSEELKKEVYDYLNDKSSISVPKEKREEELIRILTTEEDSELIRYRLRQLGNKR